MDYPKWMKPHLRQRLEAERAAKERTGPKQGEPALVADSNGKVKTITTDQGTKPLPPKVFVLVDGRTVEGLLMSEAGNICCVAITSVIGSVFVYRHPDEVVHAFDFNSPILTKPGESLIDSVNNARAEQASRLRLCGNRWREQQERDE